MHATQSGALPTRRHPARSRVILFVAMLLAGFTTGPAASPPVEQPDQAAEQRAAAAAKAFSVELRNTLMAAMSQGGPLAALEVCHSEAARIAKTIGDAHGVRLGRVGVRSRQPANRLEGWQKDVLDTWLANAPANAPGQWAPSMARDSDGTLRWAKAIETEGPCLICHGSSIEASLQQATRERYPDDPATGFEPGSLRGLLWVEVPGSTAKPAD